MIRSLGIVATIAFAVVMFPALALGDTPKVKGPVVEEGELDGAPFLIQIPENWNGGLVMYAHGYVTVTSGTPRPNKALGDLGATFGLAVAQSTYSRQGWAAEQGILETEALRQYFVEKYGETSPTIITGHSQGGFISYATIERYGDRYDGALPLCGVGSPSLLFFKERVFDMRVLFDHFFPGLPGSAVEFPEGENTAAAVQTKAAELIEENPEKAQWYADLVNLSSPQTIPGVLAFWSEILRELQVRTGGNAFDNRDTIYEGSEDDVKLNREIARFTADEKAVDYMREWATLTGELKDPVLAVHNIVDDLIPPEYTAWYHATTKLTDCEEYFVQQFTKGKGHCVFTPAETAKALSQLIDWIATGKKPEPGFLDASE